MTDSLRTRIAAVAQHCREHKPEHECVCSMPPTDWDYELADAVIRELDGEFLDFGAWLAEEITGKPMSRIDLESCLADWLEGEKGDADE